MVIFVFVRGFLFLDCRGGRGYLLIGRGFFYFFVVVVLGLFRFWRGSG